MAGGSKSFEKATSLIELQKLNHYEALGLMEAASSRDVDR
jgi:hypothetical protein